MEINIHDSRHMEYSQICMIANEFLMKCVSEIFVVQFDQIALLPKTELFIGGVDLVRYVYVSSMSSCVLDYTPCDGLIRSGVHD